MDADARAPVPPGIRFEIRVPIASDPYWMVTAAVDDLRVGYLRWDDPTREIDDVRVDERWRRRGIATAMLDAALGSPRPPVHSDKLTDDGRAWRSAVTTRTLMPAR